MAFLEDECRWTRYKGLGTTNGDGLDVNDDVRNKGSIFFVKKKKFRPTAKNRERRN